MQDIVKQGAAEFALVAACSRARQLNAAFLGRGEEVETPCLATWPWMMEGGCTGDVTRDEEPEASRG